MERVPADNRTTTLVAAMIFLKQKVLYTVELPD